MKKEKAKKAIKDLETNDSSPARNSRSKTK